MVDNAELGIIRENLNQLCNQVDSEEINLLSTVYEEYIEHPQLLGMYFENIALHLDSILPGWEQLPQCELIQYVSTIYLASVRLSFLLSVGIYRGQCGQHEEGACCFARRSPRAYLVKDLGDFPHYRASSFINIPRKYRLNKGATIYRVYDSGNKSQRDGCWWMFQSPRNSIGNKDIRDKHAILEIWNDISEVAEGRLTKNVYVWRVKASSQNVWVEKNGRIIFHNCILRGGSEQLWLNPQVISNTEISIADI